MHIPLFKKPSLPVATRRQPPKLSLFYILNPSEAVMMQQNAVVKPVVPDGSTESELISNSLSESCSLSPTFSEFEQLVPTSFDSDSFPGSLFLSYNPAVTNHGSSRFDLPLASFSGSQTSSALYLEFENLIPSIPSMPDSSYDSLPHSQSPNEGLNPPVVPRVVFDSPSHMNQGQTKLTNADGNHPINRPALRSPIEPDASVTGCKSPVIDTTPSSSMIKNCTLSQHSKMSYILNPSAPANSQEVTRPELVAPKPMHPLTSILTHSSRSPSPQSPSSTDPGTQSPTFEFNSPLHETPPTSPEPVPDSPQSTHRSISPPSSPSSPPFLSGFGRLLPPQFIPDYTFNYLPYSLVYETAGSQQGSGDNLADLAFRSVRVRVPIRSPSVNQPSPLNDVSHSRPASPESTIDLVNTPNPESGSVTLEDEYILASPVTAPPSLPPPTTVDTFDLAGASLNITLTGTTLAWFN
ncbi:hypothetical protein Clacol_000163 [Clathrus columnatus]|uniref:Uncharacterized protein n=1 Tax=Clathrus columnatus TaxID=1419009 RepID=A0AAV5A078_9AGAM|nr:hypothetical protein Clacol_000163 [Clathrus columnatus]